MRKSMNGSMGSLRKVSRTNKNKTAGTRAGILRDWRDASDKTARDSRLRPDATRDGR